MKRIKLTIEYDGAAFSGYQVQPGKRTIQGELESALRSVFNSDVATFASGRTDAGVHALGAVVHFDPPKEISPFRLMGGLNAFLPDDVKVVACEEVGEDFDARFDPKRKMYGYRFYLSRCELPLLRGRALRVNENIDVERMREAAKVFVGEHDFKSFVARKSGKTNFVRTIYSADIVAVERGYMLVISGNGFLYNMVRIIMGTLLAVGQHRLAKEDVERIMESKDRRLAGKTAPACGLYLLSVEY